MLELGVIPPTDNEFQEAQAQGKDIPHRRFYPDFKIQSKDFSPTKELPQEWREVIAEEEARVIKPPVETPTIHHDKVVDGDVVDDKIIVVPENMSQTIISPTTPPPPATPPQPTPEKIQMQQDVDKMMKEGAKPPPVKEDPVAYLQKAIDEANKKPLTPSDKAWRQKPPEPPAEPPVAEEKPPEKPEEKKNQPMIVGGELFWNMQKVRVPLSTIIWYYYCQRVYGYQGDLSEFLEWCVNDCIEARGLSIEVVENPLGLIAEGMRELHKGDGDGKT